MKILTKTYREIHLSHIRFNTYITNLIY